MNPQIVILAAGMGTRLGRPYPKPLTELGFGDTILGQQVRKIHGQWPDAHITIVVGFKRDLIMEAFPDVTYAYNEAYDQTNTAKSLLKALQLSQAGGVLWLNGDVVFDPALLGRVEATIVADRSAVVTVQGQVGEEEVKYTLSEAGTIVELSKTVQEAAGEAVGINYIAGPDKAAFIAQLAAVREDDYFEKAMELLIADQSVSFSAVDATDLAVIEVDFEEDLRRAQEIPTE